MYALLWNGITLDTAEKASSLWAIADNRGLTLYGRSATHIEGLRKGYEIREIKGAQEDGK